MPDFIVEVTRVTTTTEKTQVEVEAISPTEAQATAHTIANDGANEMLWHRVASGSTTTTWVVESGI